MKRLLAATLLVLGMARGARSQDPKQISEEANHNVAADFALTSAASEPTLWVGSVAAPAAPGPFAPLDPPTRSVSLAVPAQGVSEPYGAEGLQYRMELSLAATLVRFRSSVYSATAPGINGSFAYYVTDRIAIEGSVTTGFAPTIFANEHIKYLGYGAGPKVVLQHAKLSPWIHGIFGGAHVLPQTGLGSQKAYLIQVGGGVDYQFVPRVAVKAEVDWMRTGFFGTTQNSGQAILGLVIHF